jgi:hypothetical protein
VILNHCGPIAEKLAGGFMIRGRTRVVKRHPESDW